MLLSHFVPAYSYPLCALKSILCLCIPAPRFIRTFFFF